MGKYRAAGAQRAVNRRRYLPGGGSLARGTGVGSVEAVASAVAVQGDKVLRRLWPGLLPPPHLMPCAAYRCKVGPAGQMLSFRQAVAPELLVRRGWENGLARERELAAVRRAMRQAARSLEAGIAARWAQTEWQRGERERGDRWKREA